MIQGEHPFILYSSFVVMYRLYPYSCIDGVILSYITSVLSDMSTAGSFEAEGGDSVDIEQLIELLSAYVPDIADIDRYIIIINYCDHVYF